jgi:class 3 adenylate cyclase/tetratricopeptide (TPR) repeat protein
VQCAVCFFENPAGMKFCGKCGTALKNACPRCQFENPHGFKFCGECGCPLGVESSPPMSTPVSATAAEAGPPTRSRPTSSIAAAWPGSPGSPGSPPTGERSVTRDFEPAAERRQLTVLFCDVVDSMALSERLDPEELRDVVREYQTVSAAVVERFLGHTAQYLGDGLLVYFGFPVAHEDDPQRAVHTGLGIVAAVETLSRRLEAERGIRLAVRVGIHTGKVVAGQMGTGDTRERLALGQAPNIAARLQSLAEPGTVVVSDATFPLVQGFFVCQPLGPQILKGVSRPMELYRVLQESGVRTLFELAVTRGLTPLVGRQQDLAVLLRCFERVRSGRGQTVLLSGEPGIGKSRLVQMLKEHAKAERHEWLICRCSPFHQGSALAPVIELLADLCRFRPEDDAVARTAKLEELLGRHGLPIPEAVPLLAQLLGLPAPPAYAPLGLAPQRQRERTLETLLALLLAMAVSGPVVFLVEDLHWVDPSTLELLDLVVHQGPTVRIFALFTFRPSYDPPWAPRAHLTQITLDRLSDGEAETLVLGVTGGKRLPPEVLRQIVEKTDGVPLFVEELTKMVLASGLLVEKEERYALAGPLPPLAIPTSLQDSLMARLDRLAAVREVVQMGAVVGREFTWEIMLEVCTLDAETLGRELGQLVAAELLYQRGVPPLATYVFKHALIQDAAYGSLLKSTRQQYHQRTAAALERRLATGEVRPELLAHHYTAAGFSDRAVPYWLQAARRAGERSANLEAIGHLERGLALLQALPGGAERDRQELALRTVLGPALVATRGFAVPEVEANYARAQELCERLGDTPQLFWMLRGLWSFYLVRVSLATALDLGERMMRLAEGRGDRGLLFEGHFVVGLPLFFLGEFAAALEHFERGLALDSPDRDRSSTLITGLDVAVTSLAISGIVLWHLGDPMRARERCTAAIAMARASGHAYSLADALSSAAVVHSLRRDSAVVRDLAGDLLALSEEKGFHLTTHGKVQLGWAEVEAGEEAGLERVLDGIADCRAAGARLSEMNFLSKLVEAYARRGRFDEARRTLGEALALVESVGGRFFWKPELHRLRGELALAAESPEEARESFESALAAARSTGDKGLELRAAVSLGRLLQGSGRATEASTLLAPLCAALDAGCEDADFLEARSLFASCQ